MQGKLHPLIALTLHIKIRKARLISTVGDGDHVGWLVDPALELAFVSTGVGIGISGVEAGWLCAISRLAIGTVCAVTTINCIEESVPEAVDVAS